MGFLRKRFKQIKKGVKSVLQKVGKVFDKLGPIGTVGLMMAMPYAVQAIQGVFSGGTAAASSQAGVGLTQKAGEEVGKKVAEAATKKAAETATTEATTQLAKTATTSTLETGAGNMAKAALDNTTNQIVDNTVSGAMDKLAESATNYIKPGDMSAVTSTPTPFQKVLADAPAGAAEKSFFQKTGEFFGEVGTALRDHYTDLLTPESLKEGAVDLTTGYVESQVMTKGAEALGLIGDEDVSIPRAGKVMSQPNTESAQSYYMQEVAPMITQSTGQTYNNFQSLSQQNLYGNVTPDFLGAFSQPLFNQNILPLPNAG